MTNKEKAIYNLQQARTSHIRWINSVKLLISGIYIDEKTMKPLPTESQFGRWFYEEAMLFTQPSCQMNLEELDSLLNTLYDAYTKIYLIYYGERQGGLKSVFGIRHKANDNEVKLSAHYYEEVLRLSDLLKKKLRTFESQLMSLGEEKFEHIAAFSDTVPAPVAVENSSDEGYLYGGRMR